MAQIYHEKKLSEKIIEGVVAGLIGGAVMAVVVIVIDFAFRNGNWNATFGTIGSLVSSVNGTKSPIGMVIHLLLWALIGYGFTMYRPIFRRFNIPLVLGGAIYGLLVGLLVYALFLASLKPIVPSLVGAALLVLASTLGGAAMGLWLARPQTQARTG